MKPHRNDQIKKKICMLKHDLQSNKGNVLAADMSAANQS